MKLGLLVLVFFISMIGRAQIALPDSILTEIQNNIIVFRIKNFNYFGVSKYQTIEVVKPRFSQYLLRPRERLVLSYEKRDDLTYPKNGYEIFLVYNPNHSRQEGDIVTSTTAYDFNLKISSKFLIAYNSANKEIKYLGGEFYKSIIGPDFPSAQDSIPAILKLKYFHYDLNDIQVKRSNANRFIFTAFSKELNKKLKFRVDREYLDYIEVIK